MPARRDQLWQGMCWQVCAQIASGRPCTSLAGGRGEKMHFLGEQFPRQKMLPQRDFAAFWRIFCGWRPEGSNTRDLR